MHQTPSLLFKNGLSRCGCVVEKSHVVQCLRWEEVQMVTGQSGDERPHEVYLCGGVVVEKAFAQQGRQLGGNSIRLKHRTRIYPKN